jgi:hypothetical protein
LYYIPHIICGAMALNWNINSSPSQYDARASQKVKTQSFLHDGIHSQRFHMQEINAQTLGFMSQIPNTYQRLQDDPENSRSRHKQRHPWKHQRYLFYSLFNWALILRDLTGNWANSFNVVSCRGLVRLSR